MPTVNGTYNGEELVVSFIAEAEATDVGVRGAPTITEYSNYEIVSLSIAGVEVNPDDLPGHLVAAIYELAEEVEYVG